MQEVHHRAEEHNIHIKISQNARQYLAENGFDPKMGARPLRRLIQDEVEDAISELYLKGELIEGDIAIIDAPAPKKKNDTRKIRITHDKRNRTKLEKAIAAVENSMVPSSN